MRTEDGANLEDIIIIDGKRPNQLNIFDAKTRKNI